MAYPNNFIKVTFGGSIYAQTDIWTCGLNFGSISGDINLQEVKAMIEATAIPNNVKEWFTDPRMQISDRATLEWVKVAYIGADGKYVLDADLFEYDELVTGGTAPGYREAPIPQHTTAISFSTAVRRGAGRFGRIYPPLNGAVGNDGLISVADAQGMRDATANLIGQIGVNLSTAGLDYLPPIVASQKTDKHNEIIAVRVGRVVDTQRTRRNAFAEQYTTPVGPAILD